MAGNSRIRLLDLVMCLSDAMDFIDPAVVSHHKQVAYIAAGIGAEMGLPSDRQRSLLLAGALHDIGAFSLRERRAILEFEAVHPTEHAEAGAALLEAFGPLAHLAPAVRFHHRHWDDGPAAEEGSELVPVESHVLHLADRVAVLVNKKTEVLRQSPSIRSAIGEKSGTFFMPDAVDAFMNLASKEYFWLDIVSPSIHSILSSKLRRASIGLDSEDMLEFSRLFSRIIDFKSPFTATHSSGVAASAELLARYSGFSDRDCQTMRIAGHLHDLGKLAVPVEILDKPAALKRNEFNVIRHHAFYTFRLLDTIPSLKKINKWASFHHERLDGKGYPFHLTAKSLPPGSQIMAVADVFTAITEHRPYRTGMSMKPAVAVLENMARDHAINGDLVAIVRQNYGEMDEMRTRAQSVAERDYRLMNRRRKALMQNRPSRSMRRGVSAVSVGPAAEKVRRRKAAK